MLKDLINENIEVAYTEYFNLFQRIGNSTREKQYSEFYLIMKQLHKYNLPNEKLYLLRQIIN